jgi:ACT domain-containing protein
MVMLTDLENCSLSFAELTEKLSALGAEMGIAIRMQREDIFNAMHKI